MIRRLALCSVALACLLLSFALGREQPKRFDVVFAGAFDEGAALDNLIYVIAASHAYGERDNALLSVEAWADKLAGGDLQVQCGSIADAAVLVMRDAGYIVRRVALLTGEAWNGCDDGHQALEVWHPAFEAWLFLDFSTDRLYMQTVSEFTHERGIYRRLTDTPLAVGYTSPCVDSPLLVSIDAWYDRIAQIPLIQDADGMFYADADHPLAALASEYGYALATDWHERFYGD